MFWLLSCVSYNLSVNNHRHEKWEFEVFTTPDYCLLNGTNLKCIDALVWKFSLFEFYKSSASQTSTQNWSGANFISSLLVFESMLIVFTNQCDIDLAYVKLECVSGHQNYLPNSFLCSYPLLGGVSLILLGLIPNFV